MYSHIFLFYIKEVLYFVDKSAILSGLLSSLIIVLITSLLLPKYITYIIGPKKLKLLFIDSDSNVQKISRRENGEYEFTFSLYFDHPGGATINNGIFWNLYIPRFMNVQVESKSDTFPSRKVSDNYTNFYGYIKEPLFSQSSRELQYTFKGVFRLGNLQNSKDFPILYWMSTEYGNFPKKLRNEKNHKGIKILKTMGKLFLES